MSRLRASFGSHAALAWTLAVVTGCGGSEFSGAGQSLGAGAGGSESGGASSGTGGASGSTGTGGSTSSGGSAGGGGTAQTGGSASSGGSASGGASSSGGSGGTSGAGGSGGTPSTIQLVTSYDRACETDYDCVLVAEGDVCGCPTCHNASIARTAEAQWNADRNQIYCPLGGVPIDCPAIACAAVLPACVNQLCVARDQVVIDAANYDSSCRMDSDCRLIYLGEVCSPCQCSTAAVNLGSYTQYQSTVNSVKCTPGPSACDCAPQTTVTCVGATASMLGQCTVGP